MDDAREGHRWGRWALAAGAVLAVSATAIVVNDYSDDAQPRQRPAAVATDQQRAASLAAVAEMARENGLTGLSPLSLRPIERHAASETIAEHGSVRAAELRPERRSPAQTVAEYGSVTAIEHG